MPKVRAEPANSTRSPKGTSPRLKIVVPAGIDGRTTRKQRRQRRGATLSSFLARMAESSATYIAPHHAARSRATAKVAPVIRIGP
jgi:hypothetical protein